MLPGEGGKDPFQRPPKAWEACSTIATFAERGGTTAETAAGCRSLLSIRKACSTGGAASSLWPGAEAAAASARHRAAELELGAEGSLTRGPL